MPSNSMSEVHQTHQVVGRLLVGMGLLERGNRVCNMLVAADHLNAKFINQLDFALLAEERPTVR